VSRLGRNEVVPRLLRRRDVKIETQKEGLSQYREHKECLAPAE
jgi:hypothetical protein